MRLWKLTRRLAPYVLTGGLLWVNGCMAGLERGLDLALAPGAEGNALILPYTSLAGLARVISWLLSG